MIGIVDRPMIHYVIDEILAAGINHIIFVVSPRQSGVTKYINYLKTQDPEWKKLKSIKFDFVIQKNLWGDGDAVFQARRFVNEPCLVCFSDDLFLSDQPPAKTLASLFKKKRSPLLVVKPVPKQEVSRYGIVQTGKTVSKNLYRITDIAEKPKIGEVRSRLAIFGRYIITPKIIQALSKLYPYQNREIRLAEAFKLHIRDGGKLFGWRFDGIHVDAGSKIGILKAQIYFGLRHKELGAEFKKFLKSL